MIATRDGITYAVVGQPYVGGHSPARALARVISGWTWVKV